MSAAKNRELSDEEGRAVALQAALQATAMQGTFEWMAPESMRGGYGKEVDVYSFGVLLFELVTCRVPWKDEYPEWRFKALTAAVDGKRPPMTEQEVAAAPPACCHGGRARARRAHRDVATSPEQFGGQGGDAASLAAA